MLTSMATDVAQTVRNARAMAGLTVRQTAILAGVSPSTVSRAEKRLLDPSVSVFERILAACGFRCASVFAPNVDLDALRAARRLLEPELGIPATEGSERYARRWDAAGLLSAASEPERASELCFRAARQSCLSARPGAVGYGYREWRQVARSLKDSGQAWALTGGYAAALYTPVASVDWAVFYVADVGTAAAAASLDEVATGSRVTLIPFDEVTAAGVQELEGGLRLMSFWQIVIDCFAGTGRMPDQAEAMLRQRASAAA